MLELRSVPPTPFAGAVLRRKLADPKLTILNVAGRGDPLELLPGGVWPVDQFSWVLQLRYDHQGRPIPGETKRIQEHLLPGDPP